MPAGSRSEASGLPDAPCNSAKSPASELVLKVRTIKQQLEDLEPSLLVSSLPSTVLTDLKEAIDHVRSTLWAILQSQETQGAAKPGGPALATSLIVQLRMDRTTRLLSEIRSHIEYRDIQGNHPLLPNLLTQIEAAREQIQRLMKPQR